MRKYVYTLLFFAFILFHLSAHADQLAYISKEDCERAAKKLPAGTIVISYCSLCDNQYVEVWKVRKTMVSHTGYKDYHAVNIFYTRLFRSKKSFAEGEYKEPVEYEKFVARDDSESGLYGSSIADLAYIYTKDADNIFRPLGKQLSLKCEVKTDQVRLPAAVTRDIEKP